MSGTYRVTGDFAGTPHSFLVVADSPEHADQRVRDFFASPVGTEHKGIQHEQTQHERNAQEYGFKAHEWSYGRETRSCGVCGVREQDWDDEDNPINPCE